MNVFPTLSALFGVALSQFPDLDAETVSAVCEETFDNDAIYGQYAFVQSQMSWNEANAYCSDTYGTSLATIKNNVDAAAVLAMKDYHRGLTTDKMHVWIGLHDQNEEGNWVWASGYQCDGPCDELPWWNINEPNAFGTKEDCGHILHGANDPLRMLNDLTCSNKEANGFICDVKAICEVAEQNVFPIVLPLGLGDLALYALILSNLFVLVCLTVRCFQGHMTPKYGKVVMYDSRRK